jgi:hypothetical protein
MVGKLISLCISVIGLAAFLYVYFTMPLGELTLHEHARAILATDAAQNLGREASEAAARVEGKLNEQRRALTPGSEPAPR